MAALAAMIGLSPEEAQHWLEVADGNVELAVSMYFDSQENQPEPAAVPEPAAAPGGRPALRRAVVVPTQFGEFKMGEQGNQCAYCAHQFALHAPGLLAASGGQRTDLYRECMRLGTGHRQATCDSGRSIPVGENVDDPLVLASAERTLREQQDTVDPLLGSPRIVRAAPGGLFHMTRQQLRLMFPDEELASRIEAASDESRHPAASREEFERVVRGLAPGKVVVLERQIEAMTLIRTDAVDPSEAVLVCDSHLPECGVLSVEEAIEYVFHLIPNADFPLVFLASQ